ncbi:MAG: primosomal protein N' [Chloroflexi bacterium RBG_13_60_13]|nr:MAG: primosomal protein N' [Chloroflexi bacterium RBG_13_60_13]
MGYAEVAVNSPVAQRRTFSYSIPPSLSPAVGQAVWVPFGPRVIQGIVLQLTDRPGFEETRDVAGLIDPCPLLSPVQIELARWISDYYLAPLFDSVALMLPPGFERRLVNFFHVAPGVSADVSSAVLDSDQILLLTLLGREGKVAQQTVDRLLGKQKSALALKQLQSKGLVTRSQELAKERVKPKVMSRLRLAVDARRGMEEAQRMARKAPQQAMLLEFLARRRDPALLSEARREMPQAAAAAKALQAKGLIAIEDVHVWRDPLLDRVFPSGAPPVLTVAQEEAVGMICGGLRQPRTNSPAAFLLHGVTGSGKTEVYLRSLAEAVALGRRGIVLVPEISLTPQTIQRFAARFPGRVAVLHSRLSLGEQFDEWQRIRDGAFDVVIGPRGAIFAPQPDLGLIIIDEEHEWTYKQEEQSPRYHTREVALKLAELSGAVTVLGSATPDVESYHRARAGRYTLLELPHRITVRGDTSLPGVELVDMRDELKAGNRSIFSRALRKAIAETLADGDQIILFLNRRGTATFVQCRDCGFALKCHRCDLALTYHGAEDTLVCHQCGYERKTPATCPNCQSRRIRFLGIGIQRVVEELAGTFPQARVLRWDRDVTRGKDAHERILNSFLAHEADVLVGTQMIAKGLDLPLVTLVGVVSADTILHLPDIRAGERTFQLLSQVAGRAGRGSRPGRVVVQTYAPEHYAVAAGAKHDYAAFYGQEIDYRRQLRNPPFSRLVSLVYAHSNAVACRRGAEKLHQQLAERRDAAGDDIDLIGPSPMFFGRLRGRYRWQIILRGAAPARLLSDLALPQGWVVDVDPIVLL